MSHALVNDRAQQLAAARAFFAERKITEVDCPALLAAPSIDAYIDPLRVGDLYLHTSPEYAMKRLLVEGSGDIYQLGHVFRAHEKGSRHLVEFTMAEWYRLGFLMQQMIDEAADFVRLFVGERRLVQVTYDELMPKDPEVALKAACIEIPPGAALDHLAMATLIEPRLDEEVITAITHFPADQAALAQVEGHRALRFELYTGGLELANGYQELCDPEEHRRRFDLLNRHRQVPLPLDEPFLAALNKGLPPCCGVAVGFDRLMMARSGAKEISEVVAVLPGSV